MTAPQPDAAPPVDGDAEPRPPDQGRRRLASAAALAVGTARRAVTIRLTGVAAEMSYYALLSLVPLLIAIGAALGFYEELAGTGPTETIKAVALRGFTTVLQPDVADEIVAPVLDALLTEQRGGLVAVSLLGSLWLAGRVFRAALHGLDRAYLVERPRRPLAQLALTTAYAGGAIVLVPLLLTFFVVGPLLGGGLRLAGLLGLVETFAVIWELARWPGLFIVTTIFLAWLYRSGPSTPIGWREALPGAALGVVLLVVVAFGLRAYLAVAGPRVPDLDTGDAIVALIGQVFATVLAIALWGWLSSLALVAGGVFNAERHHRRHDPR
ncbi:MAG: YihY/virulence factor BrkB family protein [Actinomycetota bacterium]